MTSLQWKQAAVVVVAAAADRRRAQLLAGIPCLPTTW